MVKKETFEFFLDRLIKGYRSYTGKEPEGLDLIKVKQEARQKFIEQNKVIEFPQRRSFKEEIDNMIKKGEINIGTADKTPPYTPSKSQTDFELQEKFRANNEKAIEAFKKRNPKDEMATGGRAGYYGGGQAMVGEDLSEIGHGSDALMARNMQLAPNSQATTSTGLNYLLGQDNDTVRVPYDQGGRINFRGGGMDASKSDFGKRTSQSTNREKGSVTLADLIKVNASGSKSGKNQIMGAPEGITADSETFNAIIKMDIPLSKKIDLLGSYGYGKDRFKVEKGNKELFLGEGGYKDRNIGIGVNQGGEGLSGSVIRNLETGDDEFKINSKKNIDFNRLFRADGGPARQNFKMGKRAFLKLMGGFGPLTGGIASNLTCFMFFTSVGLSVVRDPWSLDRGFVRYLIISAYSLMCIICPIFRLYHL